VEKISSLSTASSKRASGSVRFSGITGRLGDLLRVHFAQGALHRGVALAFDLHQSQQRDGIGLRAALPGPAARLTPICADWHPLQKELDLNS
jgi:hypothetical protein